MKILACTVYCSASYQSSLQLPEEIKEIPEAIRYAEEHVNEIPLGTLQYIPDSDEISEMGCRILEFDETEGVDNGENVIDELLAREIFDFIDGIKDLAGSGTCVFPGSVCRSVLSGGGGEKNP